MGYMFNSDKSKEEHYVPVYKLYNTSNLSSDTITITPSDLGLGSGSNIQYWQVVMVSYTTMGSGVMNNENVLPNWSYHTSGNNITVNIDRTKAALVRVIIMHTKYMRSN